MKIVILGAGRRGIRLAKHLISEKKDVVILDNNPISVQKALDRVDCLALCINGTDVESLKEAGISDTDAFIALTGSDETNLVSCGIVSETFKTDLTIAVVRNLSYTKTNSLMGIKYIVNPYQEVASHIYKEIEQGIYTDIISFENSELVLYNVFVDEDSKFSGKVLMNLREDIPGQFIIAAISRNGQAFVPSGETVIQTGDTLSVVVPEERAEEILKTSGLKRQKPKKIAIIGGTKVTDFLLMQFSYRERKNITVIARDKEACNSLAQLYPETLIINDNIASEGLFKREGLGNYDLFIGITDNDELNIISSSYAEHIGVKNSMALITKSPDYLVMANHMGIDSLISVQDVTADSIMRYLNGDNISSIHSLYNGKLMAFEYKISKESKLCNTLLKDINMRGKGIIAGIQKGNGTTVIPSGVYQIESSDTLILVIERSSLDYIQELFGISQEV